MKRFSLFLMIVLLVSAVFISCSAEPANDSGATVAVSISSSKALSVTSDVKPLPGASSLVWYYEAEKLNGGFTTGQTSGKTLIRRDDSVGLPERIGYKDESDKGTWFSTGTWTFSFYAYYPNDTDLQNCIYTATTQVPVNAVEGDDVGGTATIVLELSADPREDSSVSVGDIYVDFDKGFDSNAAYVVSVYLDNNEVHSNLPTTVQNSTEVHFTYNEPIVTFDNNSNGGLHLIRFEVTKASNNTNSQSEEPEQDAPISSEDTMVYASGQVGVWARKGYTWTISGDLDSLESLAQVGISWSLSSNVTATSNPTTIEISSETELRALAAFVNSGNNCEGLTIKLTEDIDLTQPWTPIGNSYRGQVAENNEIVPYFAGTFDGQGYTISGLTDGDNYVPANAKANGEYSYGLFGIVKNATIKNINLTNVNIKSNNTNYTADEVGAVVGYSLGSLTLDNITVSGSVVGDSVGGIIGRAYGTSGNETIVISNCTNQAAVSSSHIHDSGANSYTDRAAGIAGYINGKGTPVTVENCINSGNITVGSEEAEGTNYIAGICCYGFNTNVVDSYTFTNNKSTGNLTILGTSGVGRVASIVYMCNEPKETTDTYSFTDASNYTVGTITVFGTTRTDVSKETH